MFEWCCLCVTDKGLDLMILLHHELKEKRREREEKFNGDSDFSIVLAGMKREKNKTDVTWKEEKALEWCHTKKGNGVLVDEDG